ncbi:MAG TPA: SEC-C metal-binding domain-containing protein, partial [Thermodesulfobacteriota bacterium]|nr:SEC-C metal-binding domain-containing protein [Thermodesulfobacteriota bacterium]
EASSQVQEVCERLFKVQITREEDVASLEPVKRPHQFVLSRGESPEGVRGQGSGARDEKPKPVHVEQKVGRNEPCPCGSGKKYKKCCGK